jgi:hypothetical protein
MLADCARLSAAVYATLRGMPEFDRIVAKADKRAAEFEA